MAPGPATVRYLGRMIMMPAALAHLFALAGLVGYLGQYRWPVVAAAVFAFSLLLPFAMAGASRRAGGRLPTGAALPVAVASRLDAEAASRELDVVRLADVRRIGTLREQLEPLLEHVAEQGSLPLDAARAATARDLAERLREALAAQRQTLWLPEQLGPAPLVVVCADVAVRATCDTDRAWLGALIDLLGRHPGWRRARLVLDVGAGARVNAVLTADGPSAAQALADPSVRALCASRAAHLDRENELLVVDADLLTNAEA
jgi:hypothetical protein